MLKRIIYILIISFFWFTTLSQVEINYTVKDGLPSNSIYQISQDNKGFMWFATNRGVAKFDGINFKVFTTKDGLPNNDIWRITIDEEDRVWFNTKSKYQGYIKNDSVYKFTTVDEQILVPVSFNTNKGSVTLTYGSWNYKLKNKQFVRDKDYFNDEINKRIENLYSKKSIKEFNHGVFFNNDCKNFLFYDSDSVCIYDSNFYKYSKIKFDKEILPVEISNAISLHGMLPNNTSYISGLNGLLLVNCITQEKKYFDHKELTNYKKLFEIPLVISKGNRIQISCSQNLIILDNKFNIIERRFFYDYPSNKNSYMDNSGNIWLNDFKKGVTFIPRTRFTTPVFLKERKIQKIGKIKDKIIFGEYNMGIHYYNKSKNKFEIDKEIKFKKNIYQIKSNSALNKSLIVSYPSYLLTEENSLIKKSKVFCADGKDFIGTINCNSSFKDIETIGKGFFAVSGGSIIEYDSTYNIVRVAFLRSLNVVKQFNKKIYCGSNEGLLLFEKDSLIQVLPDNELTSSPIIFLSKDSNFLYAGTDGKGVFLFDEKKTIHLRNTDGFIVQKIIKRGSKLWLATQNGVQVVELDRNNLEESLIINSFYESDGLLQNNTNDIFIEDNELWVATDIGASRININSKIYNNSSKIVFDFENDTVEYRFLRKQQISVFFRAINYTNQEYLKYEYRLLPLFDEWISTNSGAINFSGLSPNSYTLEVKVTDQHNIITTGRQVVLITPIWYQTTLARIAFGLLFFLITVLFFKLIQRRVKKIESVKSERKAKLAGLELQALRSQMNPHFVHNSLNAIKYFIQRNESELSEEYLVKFSKLIRLFFDFSQKEVITLEEELGLIKTYLQIEQLRFEDKMSFRIDFDSKIDIKNQIIPSMILQPIIENSVNHGLFHKKGNGLVSIRFNYLNKDEYSVIIQDDGIGINVSKEIHSKSSKNYKSKSSDILEKRLELLRKEKKWEISYKLEDLSKEDNQSGTIVELIFKQNK